KLYVELKYSGVISYDVKANIETGLKTTYDFAVTANTKHKISLAVQWKDAEDDVLMENDEQLASEITAILQDRSNIPSKVIGEAKSFGKTFEVPLCEDFTYVIPNTPITANIGFKWIIGVQVQGEIFTDLEMQSSDTLGVRSIEKDGEDSQEFYHIKSKDSSNDTMIMGAVTVKTGIRVDVYFSIVGMSKNIRIGIKGDAGIYLTVKGISLKTDINTEEKIGVIYGEVGLFVGYEVYGKVFVGFKIVGDDYSVKLFDFGTDEIYTDFVETETTIKTTKRITLNGNIDSISPVTQLNKLAVNKFKVSEFGIETESLNRSNFDFEMENGYITYYGGQFFITTAKHQFTETIKVTLKADDSVTKTIIVTYDDGYVAPVEVPSESETTTETPVNPEETETPVEEQPSQPVETPDEGEETETPVDPIEPETPVVEEEEEIIMSTLELYDGNKKLYEIVTQWVENENGENVETYAIPALTKLGYTFKGYALSDGTLVTTENNGSFTYKMPLKTIETIKVSAVWEKTYKNYNYVTVASDIKSIDKNANYYFLNDIDMWGVEFNAVSEFNGIIEGNGFKINNFTISGDNGYTGFIGINNGTIKNLTIQADINYTSSKENIYCGIIAAVNKGTISGCATNGEINVEMKGNAVFVSEYNGYVGGVVGTNDGGTITDCKTLANVYVTTNNVRINPYAGGFAGANLKGTISNSSANSYVKSVITNAVSVCKSYAGGFTALNKGVINGCSAKAYDKTSASDFVGGFAAVNEGSVKKSFSTGKISGKDNVGGLIGHNSGTVVNCYSQVTVSGKEKVGGLVGYNSGKISYAYASGNASGEKSIGGLVGENAKGASIVKAFAKGNVTSTKDVWISKEWAGGLVGKNDGSVTGCYRAQTQVLDIEDCECTVGTIVTQSVYNQATFYTQLLGFGSSTWNLSNGKLPTLK
ncbi:MAG: GLUG motif-containing protein, partial [Christensenellales bacterium]